MAVILINPFALPPDADEEEFLARWRRVADFMRRQKGFVRLRFHRSLDPAAKFRFVNVAEWERAADFRAAIATDEFRRLTADAPPHFPALYEVVGE